MPSNFIGAKKYIPFCSVHNRNSDPLPIRQISGEIQHLFELHMRKTHGRVEMWGRMEMLLKGRGEGQEGAGTSCGEKNKHLQKLCQSMSTY